jgi:hypothetical protein
VHLVSIKLDPNPQLPFWTMFVDYYLLSAGLKLKTGIGRKAFGSISPSKESGGVGVKTHPELI